MENKKSKFSKPQIFAIIFAIISIVGLLLPITTGISTFEIDMKHSYNVIDMFMIMFGINVVDTAAKGIFYSLLIVAAAALVIGFVALIVLLVMTIMKSSVTLRRFLAVVAALLIVFGALSVNMTLTSSAKAENNFYEIYPDFAVKLKYPNGSVNTWAKVIDKFAAEVDVVFAGKSADERADIASTLAGLSADATAKSTTNQAILSKLLELVPVEEQEAVFAQHFAKTTKIITAVKSTYGVGVLVALFGLIGLCACVSTERNANGFRSLGVPSYCMFAALSVLILLIAVVMPAASVPAELAVKNAGDVTGFVNLSLVAALLCLPKMLKLNTMLAEAGLDVEKLGAKQELLFVGALLVLAAVIMTVVLVVLNLKKYNLKKRKMFSIVTTAVYIVGLILASVALADCVVKASFMVWMLAALYIANMLSSLTVYIDKEHFKVFSVVNVIVFVLISAIIIVPIWKVLVDSLDYMSGYGMKFWPEQFSLLAYKTIVTNSTMYRPFLVSVITTVAGTACGLVLSTLGAYVLIQFEMPGRNFFANMLLFTMIFSGGMIPTYLVISKLGLLNSLWSVILPLSINVYNLVLMRNFFEGIPKSLFESAQIDGCSPMGIFVKIVLPLSKAALASIGLMFAVSFWNDYTNYKLYITNRSLYNFQMKLRDIVMSSDLPSTSLINPNTITNASVMVAILPFMIIYPKLQKYFVKGVNIGAVKE